MTQTVCWELLDPADPVLDDLTSTSRVVAAVTR